MSMVQFNLLPDIKIEYIKARRQKRLIILAATGTIVFCVAVLLLLFSIVFIGQRLRLDGLDDSITKKSDELKDKPDIDKVLTIQNQLSAINALHDAKPETARIFTYIAQVTPSKINLSTYTVSFSEPTMAFTGTATSLEDVNKFADTLKFTTVTREGKLVEDLKPFSQVVLSEFSSEENSTSPDKPIIVTFTITVTYDPVIFSSAETKLALLVPEKTTTRSETEQPSEVFQAPPAEKEGD